MLAARALHAQSATERAGAGHRYSLADFGLTEHEVDERFASI